MQISSVASPIFNSHRDDNYGMLQITQKVQNWHQTNIGPQ